MVEVTVTWFNKKKNFGEGVTKKGETVMVTGDAICCSIQRSYIKPGVKLNATIQTSPDYGAYTFKAELLKAG